MRIAVYGAGYVGLVSAVCFAAIGHDVMCMDIDAERILELQKGHCPIYEQNLPQLLQDQLAAGRLTFTPCIEQVAQFTRYHFIAVGTPSLSNGEADLSALFDLVENISLWATDDLILVCKSTVPVGTTDIIERLLQKKLLALGKTIKWDVAANPEFLKEGSAVADFLNAERIVVGGSSYVHQQLQMIYQPLIAKGIPYLTMSRQSAELAKYAANAMLASRISFINQISQIAELTGANIDEIKDVLSRDKRIGAHFLNAGIGYGGSCFPKDIRALIALTQELGLKPALLQAIDQVNQQQSGWIFEQLKKHFHANLQHRCIGFWGLAFKPGTDDLREASSIAAIKALLAENVRIIAYDPVVGVQAKQLFNEHQRLSIVKRAEEVFLAPIDALIIATEWEEFKTYPLAKLKRQLKKTPLFDGRNCFSYSAIQQANLHHYCSVGRPIYHSHSKQKEFTYAD